MPQLWEVDWLLALSDQVKHLFISMLQRHCSDPGNAVEWFTSLGGLVDSMSLNIKNERTQKLARELAKLTGESMTAAVTEAVRERLDRVREEQGVGLADRLLKIGKDCAAHLKEPYRSVDHGELLYNEKGLPR
jgi:antitoxin VapB